jgi:hypothetical protein
MKGRIFWPHLQSKIPQKSKKSRPRGSGFIFIPAEWIFPWEEWNTGKLEQIEPAISGSRISGSDSFAAEQGLFFFKRFDLLL